MRATISVMGKAWSQVTSCTAVEPTAFTAWTAATHAYAVGDLVSVAADFQNYECIYAHTSAAGIAPLTSPSYWRPIGPTEAEYVAATTNYALGATVAAIAGTDTAITHRVYESLVLQTASHPLPVLPETQTDYWIDRGLTNKYAAFDLDRNSQTVYTSPCTWVVTPGERINALILTKMVANTLTVKMTSAAQGGTIYPLLWSATTTYAKNDCVTNAALNQCYQSLADTNLNHAVTDAAWWTAVAGAVFDLNTRQVFNATDYYYNAITTLPSKGLFGLPLVTDCVITVTLASTAGNVKLGALGVGKYIYLGSFLKPARNEGVNFSTVTRDAWGGAIVVKRRTLPKMSGALLLDAYRIDSALAARDTLNAQPAFFSGVDEDGDWTNLFTILGINQKLDIETNDSSDKATVQFEAEEI